MKIYYFLILGFIIPILFYLDSASGEEDPIITVSMDGDSKFYLDSPSIIIRASVEITNYTPSDGQYFMQVTHLPTGKILKDFEIYPKGSGNDLWSTKIAYPILESDINGRTGLFGEFEIHIHTEKGSSTASTTFFIFESQDKQESEHESSTSDYVDSSSTSTRNDFGTGTIQIPDWIQNNAGWWADGFLPDSEFLKGIQYLINEKIIQIDATSSSRTIGVPTIPDWIKNNAGWWADGQLSDQDFVNGLTWLIENGAIIVETENKVPQTEEQTLDFDCLGNARCFTGKVTSVIDGDTIKIDGKSIRFAMASAPELDEPGGNEARIFIEAICSVGSIAGVDEDDLQTQGSYGRILGVVYCNGNNLNADLLDSGHGYLISEFCGESEFANEYWAQNHGCSTYFETLENGCTIEFPYLWSDGFCYGSPEFLENGCPWDYPYLWEDGMCYTIPEPEYEEPKYEEPKCDDSYPDVCIAPYPPDLDCDEIPYTDFRVFQPDPHGFDTDYDGIGCETEKPTPPPPEPTPEPEPEPEPDCDPSYPDFCIPPPPPDLDCGDIPQKNFTVLQPDPHRFDGDKDGIGCES